MKLLFVDSCIRGCKSRTLILCTAFIEGLKRENPELEVERIILEEAGLSALTWAELERRDQLCENSRFDDPFFTHARKFAEADYIVIGAPYWDLSFPAILKAYVEQICVCGLTFKYQGTDCIGLCKAKRMMYISTAGGNLEEKHMGEIYLKSIAKMLGIPMFDTYCLEGLDIYGADTDEKMQSAYSQLEHRAAAWLP